MHWPHPGQTSSGNSGSTPPPSPPRLPAGFLGRYINMPDVNGFGFAATADLAPPFPDLAARGVVLRPLGLDDEEAWESLVASERDRLPSLGIEVAETYDEVLADHGTYAAMDFAYCNGVFLDDQLVGEAALHDIQRNNLQGALFTMWLAHSASGQGLDQVCYLLTLLFAFDHLELHRVDALVPADANGGVSAIEELGIGHRGVERGAVRVHGEWVDHVRYTVMAEDFAERRAGWTADWLS